MGYIRSRSAQNTGYQERARYSKSIDLGCDFVMVYGTDDGMPERVKAYRDAGYEVHLMTGIAWGEYQDYLLGEWDGKEHLDEGQRNRKDEEVSHGYLIPYMCPTESFTAYLSEKLKVAVDAGVLAIHVEEPEYWDRSGYSKAFIREYEAYYKEPWKPKHENADAQYKASRLKTYLYFRAISTVSSELKKYAREKYGRDLGFYVPTHSLINYTTWKIMSPESELLDIPTLDGYIAQIWTGTSREGNVFEGVYRERTFETAFLEYGVMQELVAGSGRRIWFLNDPIEDLPMYTWKNYEENYRKTAVASLLAPDIHDFEICPWPDRIFNGKYPKLPPEDWIKVNQNINPDVQVFIGNMTDDEKTPKPIPEDYATFLSTLFQLFGDMDQKDYHFDGVQEKIGVFMSDSALYQRTFPDDVDSDREMPFRMSRALWKNSVTDTAAIEELKVRSKELMGAVDEHSPEMLGYIESCAFPQFYGLALPLLKAGLPVHPVQLDNLRRFEGILDGYSLLVLSYEFLKPFSEELNLKIAEWVKAGGTLLYVGDGSDPFHNVDSWWKNAGYANPAQHLFEKAGIPADAPDGSYAAGRGRIYVVRKTPAAFTLTEEASRGFRDRVRDILAENGVTWEYRNDLTLYRGPYVISAVMDESMGDAPKTFSGLFADITEVGLPVIRQKMVAPDTGAVLFDIDAIGDCGFRVIATAARVLEAKLWKDGAEGADISDVNGAQVRGNIAEADRFELKLFAAERIKVYTRIRLPFGPSSVEAVDEAGRKVELTHSWDADSRTLLVSYLSDASKVTVTGHKN